MNWCVQQCTCTCTRFQLTQSARYRGKQQRTKESGLITEFSYNVKPTFYPRTVFCHQHPLPEGVFNCRWRADNCIVYYIIGGWGWGVNGNNFNVYGFYAVDCARKNRQLSDFTVLLKSLLTFHTVRMGLLITTIIKEYIF